MPYNYYPASYQPAQYYPAYMPQMQQAQPQYAQYSQQAAPAPQNPQTQVPAAPVTSGMLWVSDEREASLYPVAPNTAVALWNSKAPYVYIKQSDASGKPSLKVYALTEQAEDREQSKAEAPAQNYATKDELAAVVGAVKDFGGSLASLRNDLDAVKGDMYGIAGKKKTAKKNVEDEDE